jgi:hypothetical protein
MLGGSVRERGRSPIELGFPNLGDNVEAVVDRKWPSTVIVAIDTLAVKEQCGSTLIPKLTSSNATSDRSFGSQQSLEQHLNPASQFQNANHFFRGRQPWQWWR